MRTRAKKKKTCTVRPRMCFGKVTVHTFTAVTSFKAEMDVGCTDETVCAYNRKQDGFLCAYDDANRNSTGYPEQCKSNDQLSVRKCPMLRELTAVCSYRYGKTYVATLREFWLVVCWIVRVEQCLQQVCYRPVKIKTGYGQIRNATLHLPPHRMKQHYLAVFKRVRKTVKCHN